MRTETESTEASRRAMLSASVQSSRAFETPFSAPFFRVDPSMLFVRSLGITQSHIGAI